MEKFIPQRFWLKDEESKSDGAEEKKKSLIKCPLKCSTPFSEQSELLNHFRVVHGFNNDIIKKVLKAHPQLNALGSDDNYGKRIEA